MWGRSGCEGGVDVRSGCGRGVCEGVDVREWM